MLGLSPVLLGLSFPTRKRGSRPWPHTELRSPGTGLELEAGNPLARGSSTRKASEAVLFLHASLSGSSPGVSLAPPPVLAAPALHSLPSHWEQSGTSHFMAG